MAKYKADVTLQVTVEFDDDGENSFEDQAWDAAMDSDRDQWLISGGEVHVTTIRKVETPT